MPRGNRHGFREFFPFATLVQKRLSELYEPAGIRAEAIKTTVALDVSYSKDVAYTAAVVYRVSDSKVLEVQREEYGVHFPYIPGYLYMREAPAILRILAQVESDYDVVLVDAHGRLHPRGAGLATIVGVLLDRPVIGIAKSLLTGEIRGRGEVRPIYLGEEVEGWYVRNGKAFYASPGNKIAVNEVRRWLRMRMNSYPKELTEADLLSKKLRETSEAEGPS